MKKILVITEKPSVANDIAKVLKAKKNGDFYENDKYLIVFAIGHLVTLYEPEDYDKKYRYWRIKDLPIIPNEFKLKPIKEVEKHFLKIKSLLNKNEFEYVVNACDAGREGEIIFRFIYKLSDSKIKVKRLWLNALTEEEILKGFSNLRDGSEFDNLGKAGEARAEADWLVGINATRTFSRKEGLLLSIGRVQTPTLSMIVQREREIISFIPKKYYEINALFKKEKFKYEGKWIDENKDSKIFDKNKFDLIFKKINVKEGIIEKIDKKVSKILPPLLYDLTELQREANRLFGFTAQKTLSIAQSLYESEKLITYPRTDSRYLPSSMKKDVVKIFKKLSNIEQYNSYIEELMKGELNFNKRIVDDSKVTDHFAIIPTGVLPKENLNRDKKLIFDLITKRFISVFYPSAEQLNLSILTIVNGEKFKTEKKYITFSGWMRVYGKEEEEFKELPIKEKDIVEIEKVEFEEKMTEPPPRFTDGTLLSLMETCGKLVEDEELKELLKEKGIGTPATRAQIIERLIEVGYIERENKNLVPLPKGMKLIEALEAIPLNDLISPELTGEWEKKLLLIEKGILDYKSFINDIVEFTKKIVKDILNRGGKSIKDEIYVVIGKCPECNSNLIEGERGYFCEKFREKKCKFYLPKKLFGRKIEREEILELINFGRTKLLDGFISKNKRRFSAYLVLKNSKVELEFPLDKIIDDNPVGKCPICNSNIVETETKFRCENENCSFKISKNILGQKITREDVINLINGEETRMFQFKSKGRRFKAKLKLNKDKLSFIFEEKNNDKRNS